MILGELEACEIFGGVGGEFFSAGFAAEFDVLALIHLGDGP